MIKTNDDNNYMVYLDTGLHSCVHKNVLFTWYMLCKHTHTGVTEVKDFQNKSVVASISCLVYPCVCCL